MEATARMKEGEACDLLKRLAGEPALGITETEMEELLQPERYTGRCAEQVETYVAKIRPLLEEVRRQCTEIAL